MNAQPMSRLQLTILPFASVGRCDTLQSTLGQLGYPVTVVNNQNTLTTNMLNTHSILVLLLEKSTLLRQPLLSFLTTKNIHPSLGILDGINAEQDSDILRYCDEFTGWPCNAQELSIRLQRLTQQYNTSVIDNTFTTSSAFADEFLHFNLIGRSPCFVETLQRIKKIAQCNAPVLIDGETGTGKELAARAIHYMGGRKDYPFIPVNCGALPDNLIENELFGHAKGAYTDAKESQPGLIAQADGGTLFLDEVDSLSLKAQVTLLRFLQDQKYLPLGAKTHQQANVRVIAATNRDLPELVQGGDFRQDLYFRMNLMSVSMPPLRMRQDDSELLARHFVQHYRLQYHQPEKRLHSDTLEWIKRQDWPGNVRELENFIHREFLLCETGCISLKHPLQKASDRRRQLMDRRQAVSLDLDFSEAKARAIATFEKRYLSWLVSETNGNVTHAAKRAGKERRAFGKLLKKHGISPRLGHT